MGSGAAPWADLCRKQGCLLASLIPMQNSWLLLLGGQHSSVPSHGNSYLVTNVVPPPALTAL